MTTLTITNRTVQNFVVNFPVQPPTATGYVPGKSFTLPPSGQGTFVPNNASDPDTTFRAGAAQARDAASVNCAIAALVVFGMMPDAQADAFNAARNPLSPPWSGLTYTVS